MHDREDETAALQEAASSKVRLELATGRSDPRITAAVALGDQAASTLGLLPPAVYEAHADKKGLLLAVDPDGTLVGYAMFALTVRRVRLVHLCVQPAYRRHGIARLMADWIGERHAERSGVLAWCRRDYRLGPMWSALGFRRLEERPGRGRRPTTLVAWWRDHGHPSLIAGPRPDAALRASIDLNILRDYVDEGRTDRAESMALVSDQLVDQLELVRTPALDLEIEAMDDDLRIRCGREAATLRAVSPDGDRRRVIEAEALRVAAARDPEFLAQETARADVRYVSEAIAGGLNIFVTRDSRLRGVLGEFAVEQGLQILRPAEVFVRIDELVRAEAYRPGQVASTLFTRRLLRAGEEALVEEVGGQPGERPSSLRSLVRRLTVGGAERVAILDASGAVAAVYFVRESGGVLSVGLLRVRQGEFAQTLVRQILFALRAEAIARGACLVRIEDPHLARSTVAAAAEDGFVEAGSGYIAIVLNVAGGAASVSEAAASAYALAQLPPPRSVRSGLAAVGAAELERIWWPAKIVDASLPTYLVPIQQTFSQELLGAPMGVFARSATLGLSREHVYYRSPRGPKFAVPARLLWYMSASARGSVEPAAVVASSLLEDVIVGSPTVLHQRFRHLGVWRVEQIEAAGIPGAAQALRFSYTETFARPVTAAAVRRIVGSIPQGPRLITSEQFEAIYGEAHQHG